LRWQQPAADQLAAAARLPATDCQPADRHSLPFIPELLSAGRWIAMLLKPWGRRDATRRPGCLLFRPGWLRGQLVLSLP